MIEYIRQFSITKYSFLHMHTSGSLLSFAHPCIGYLKKGYGKFFYKGNIFYANEGDLIYIAKDTKYYSMWFGKPEIIFYSINLSFSPSYAFYDYRFQIVENYPCNLLDEMYSNYDASPLLSIANLYMLLDDLYPKMQAEDTAIQFTTIEPAISYIEDNYATPITIDKLSKMCHCSKSSLFHLFHAATGVSPIAYKHNTMIQYALDMLVHTDLTIEEISQRTGFSSSNYFRTVFLKLTGKTPREVRTKK